MKLFTAITARLQHSLRQVHNHVGPVYMACEVERKFKPNPQSVAQLRMDVGFESVRELGKAEYYDRYLDRDGILMKNGIYIRMRNDKVQAKIRIGGDFIDTQFLEVEGDLVWGMFPFHLVKKDDLLPVATFMTERESYMLNNKYRVDIDKTNFGHMVGEIELLQEYIKKHRSNNSTETMEEFGGRMDAELEAFLLLHPWAFPREGEIKSKLTAYFEWKKAGGGQC